MPFEPRFATLVDVLEHAVGLYGSRDLFGTKRAGGFVWTKYAEFGKAVDQFRGGLASLGVGRGDRVAIVSNNRVEWAVAAYASYGLGAAIVPMYEAQAPKEWAFIVRDSESKVAILATDAALRGAREPFAQIPTLEHLITLESSAPSNGSAGGGGGDEVAGHGQRDVKTYASLLASGHTVAAIHPDRQETAGIIYTSGTTGDPKGVVLSHENLASNVSAMHNGFPMGEVDVSLSILPWAHSFGQTVELHCLLSVGASIAICEGVDKLVANLTEARPTVLMSVPRIFNRLYTAVQQQLADRPKVVRLLVDRALRATAKQRAAKPLSLGEKALLAVADRLVFRKVRARFGGRLKYAISGGAALSQEVAEFIDSMGITVYEGYGLTETSPISTANVPGARRIGSVGRAIAGVRVEIDPATAEKRPAEGSKPERLEGEVVVHGLNVMKGYFHRPEETAAVFTPDGGFRSGDMGYLDPDGFLFITGRVKEQYKLENGKYVVPTPLEEPLKLSPYIANAMVHGANRPFNVALVVLNVPAVRRWAEHGSIKLPEGEKALLEDARVRELIKGEVDRYNAKYKSFETIREFALIGEDFSIENGMLTPSLKLKRRQVIERYGALIEQLYARPRSASRRSASADA